MFYDDLEKAKHYYLKGLVTVEELRRADFMDKVKRELVEAETEEELQRIHNKICREKEEHSREHVYPTMLEELLIQTEKM